MLSLPALALLAATAGASLPPVIIISADTLRSDRLPAYGYRGIRTPHLDELRGDSVLFERAWSPYPLTAPAHASIFTGLLPGRHGVRDNSGYTLTRGVRTLPEILARHGYATGAAISSEVLRASTGLSRGFSFYDESFQTPERSGTETVGVALSWLSANKSKPPFLFVHLYEPHWPYEPLPSIADPYDAEIVRVDVLVGRLVEGLRRREIYDQSLVVFLSDHGEGLRDHGEQQHGVLLYREALQIPLMVKFPGNRWRGRRVSSNVQLIDIAPTIIDQIARPVPGTFPGVSLAGLVTRDSSSRAIYAETWYPRNQLGWHELRSMIRDDVHLIAGRRVELYDLTRDPGEKTDLSDSSRRKAVALLRELRAHDSPATRPNAGSARSEALSALGYLSGGGEDETVFHPEPRDRIMILPPMLRLMTALRRDQNADALRITNELLSEHPTFIELWERKAMALLGLGRKKEAEAAAREATRLRRISR
jgi:arylsulfatase A-like enzyme